MIMEVNIEDLLDKVSEHVKTIASTETVLGEEFKLGEYTCRPVIKVGTGFGSGAGVGDDPKGKNKGSGGGAGAAMGIVPVGFLAAKGDQITFIQVDRKSPLSDLVDKVPEMVDKFAEMKKKGDDGEEKKEEKKEGKK
jgi:uncharacterized spore protein YtfJ